MGSLFPDAPDHPDHQPIPSVAGEIPKMAGIPTLAFTLGLAPLCPVMAPMMLPDDPPRPDFTPRNAVATTLTVGSSSSTGNHVIRIPAGELSTTGWSPTVLIGSS